jgi:cytochrome c oxidase cbb3-type subunit I/II
MPNYAWLLNQKLDATVIGDRMRALRKVGVPYSDTEIADASKSIDAQQRKIVVNLAVGSITNAPADREIIAVIAYLQRLGTDIKSMPANASPTNAVAEASANAVKAPGS